ncbi:MAG: hypothetical protein ABIK28_05040 [Planctomycetota bacterium]
MAKKAKIAVSADAPVIQTGTKKKGKKKRAKTTVEKTARRGRPRGTKNAKKAGRPAKKAGRPAKRGPKRITRSIELPIDNNNLAFWSEMVVFLNDNKGKSFIVQMDGTNYTLCAT